MKRRLVHALAAIALLTMPGFSHAETAVESLAAAERAFSARSVESGMKTAFLEFLSPEAIVFSPGPVNGHKVWALRPESKAVLIWEPYYGEVSYAGDLGLSFGPFELRPPAGSDAQTLHGHFISMWGRDKGEPWRVWIDIGSVHAPQGMRVGDLEFTAGPEHPKPSEPDSPRSGWSASGRVRSRGMGLGVGLGSFIAPRPDPDAMRAAAIHEMMTAERTYAFHSRGQSIGHALKTVAATDVRIFRQGVAPNVGRDAAVAAAGDGRARVKWIPKGRVMSASNDFGYSYGLAVRKAQGAAKPDSGAYMHVWRNIGSDGWKLVVDVENPFPPR